MNKELSQSFSTAATYSKNFLTLCANGTLLIGLPITRNTNYGILSKDWKNIKKELLFSAGPIATFLWSNSPYRNIAKRHNSRLEIAWLCGLAIFDPLLTNSVPNILKGPSILRRNGLIRPKHITSN